MDPDARGVRHRYHSSTRADLCRLASPPGSGLPFSLAPLELSAELPPAQLSAYSRLLLDIPNGDSTLSIRADEAEEAWRVVTPILQAWTEGRPPLEEYPAGSTGPPPLRPGGRR